MKILVYGAGAVGGYVGARLAHSGHAVTFVNRPATAAQINAHGVTVVAADETLHVTPTAVDDIAAAFARDQQYDLIVLGMKSYDLAEAQGALAAVCPRPAMMLTLQNGIGIERPLIEQFGARHVIAGALTTPVSKKSATELIVERSDRGLGMAPTQPGHSIAGGAELMTQAGINVKVVADYEALKWSKALLNIVGNATSAILDRSPGVIYRTNALFDLEISMLRETLAVMDARQLKPIDLPGSPARRLAFGVRYAPRFLLKPVLTRIVARGRGNKMPSFHIDLASGCGQSEVLYHNGAIAAAGQALGLPMPVNAALNDVLLQITRGQVPWENYTGRPERLLALVDQYKRERPAAQAEG